MGRTCDPQRVAIDAAVTPVSRQRVRPRGDRTTAPRPTAVTACRPCRIRLFGVQGRQLRPPRRTGRAASSAFQQLQNRLMELIRGSHEDVVWPLP
jgi:hypothetical protein